MRLHSEEHRTFSRERTVAMVADKKYFEGLKTAETISDPEERRVFEEKVASDYQYRRSHQVIELPWD